MQSSDCIVTREIGSVQINFGAKRRRERIRPGEGGMVKKMGRDYFGRPSINL